MGPSQNLESVNVLDCAGSLTNSCRVLKYGVDRDLVAEYVSRIRFMLIIQIDEVEDL
jgi:hypothetical protein